jgi:hypothetical protein
MSYVLRGTLKDEVVYKTGQRGSTTDLQKARVFGRRCDASNARWRDHRVTGVQPVEVNIVEVAACE